MDKRAEIAEKTERLMRMLAAERLGGVILCSQHNFSWLTAGGTNGVDLSRDPGVSALLVRADGRRYLLASRIEMARMLAEEVSAEDFEPIEFGWEEEKASPSFLADRAAALLESNNGTLGADMAFGAEAKVIEGVIARCRFSLTDAEIERFRGLGQDAGEALEQLARTLEPGETETEVARRMADVLAARGIRSVVTLVAADERLAKFRHPVPTNARWERVLMVVTCARRQGLVASLSRIICAGEIRRELRERTQGCARVNAKLLAATQPGTSGADLYEVAARAYAAEGFEGEEHLHHQGGAAGYRTRDWVAHPACQESVQVNQAFAWNPSITGTKVEETCIASAEGIEIITSTPDWPKISTEVDGHEYLSPDVLSL